MMPSTEELAAVRAAQERLMPETVTVQRVSTSADGYGGTVRTDTTVATVAGRVGPLNRQELSTFASKIEGRAAFTVTVPYGTDIATGDRIAIGDRTFQVINAPQRSLTTAVRCVTTETT